MLTQETLCAKRQNKFFNVSYQDHYFKAIKVSFNLILNWRDLLLFHAGHRKVRVGAGSFEPLPSCTVHVVVKTELYIELQFSEHQR